MTDRNDFGKELEAIKIILSILEPFSEEQRKFVLKTAAERFGLVIPKNQNFEDFTNFQASAGEVNKQFSNMSPKEFLKIKKPDSDVLRVVCLAYYLTYVRNQATFKSEEIASLNIEAAYQNFGNPLKTVNNAMTRSHFLAPAGGGKKQITAHGEDIVNALPDPEKVAEIIKEHKKGKRAKPKKNKNKQ